MSKIIRTRKPSVLPFYAMALVFLVLCAVLPVYKLWALLAALGGAFVAFGAAQKVCPPRVVEHEVPFHTGVEDVDAMLTDIQQKLDTLHTLNEQLPDPQLSAAMTRMEKAGRSIVEAVEANPEKAKQVRRFANYYLPDAVNVLQQYAKLAKQGVRGENAAAIRTEVEHNAASIATAFENQLDALSVYLDSDIWIINPSGRMVLTTEYPLNVDEVVIIENFDPTLTANSYYNVSNFFNYYDEAMLNVIAPITTNYKVNGYVVIHASMASVYESSNSLLTISYITMCILFFLSMIILIFFTEIVYKPLRKITYATEQYASGNMHYEFQVESEDEMGYLAACLNYMASEIARSEDDQKKFVANVSHDFRSPLTSIRGYLEAMLDLSLIHI